MTTTTWTVQTEGGQHIVKLIHGTVAGKREIFVDDVMLEKGRILLDYGSRHVFVIDKTNFDLSIVTNGVTYQYFLSREGTPILSDKQRLAGKVSSDIYTSKYLRDLPFWEELSHILGLRYRSMSNVLWDYRHNLIGMRQEYMVRVHLGPQSKTNKPGWFVMVRHAPFQSQEQLDRIQSDERIQTAHGSLKKHPDDILFQNDYTYVFLPKIRNQSASELAVRIQKVLSGIAAYVSPLPMDACENSACKHQSAQEPGWVLINEIPRYLCPDCIAEIPSWGEAAKQEYQSAPNNLFSGIIVGLGAAILGAVAWAAMGILLNIIAAVSAYVILVGIMVLMRKVETKMTAWSIIFATILTFFSVTLGQILFGFLLFVREGFPLNVGTIAFAIEATISDRSSLFLAYFFASLGAVPSLWSFISGHRSSMKEAFQPRIEKLPM